MKVYEVHRLLQKKIRFFNNVDFITRNYENRLKKISYKKHIMLWTKYGPSLCHPVINYTKTTIEGATQES